MKKKKQYKILSIIIAIMLCCFFSSIAYSAIYTTMSINGIAYARLVKDVRITDFRLSSSNNATSQYEEFSKNSISMRFNFTEQSSSIMWDVEVTNYGNVDVGLFNLEDAIDNYPNVSCNIYNQIPGEKLCDDNGKCNTMAVKTFQIGCSGVPGEYEQTITFDFREYHSVTYTGITNNNYPTEIMNGSDLYVDFTEELKRIAVYQNGEKVAYYPTVYQGSNLLLSNVTGNIEIKQEEAVAKLVSGKIDEVGSEVCIKDECFYIISNDDSTVSMLAKYNLHVGNSVDEDGNITPLANPTGIQDEEAKGYNLDNENSVEIFPFIGVTAFSYDGTTYSGSVVEGYVNSYNSYLTTQGVMPIETRLITKDELISLGCSEDDYSCSTAPRWVLTSSYWSGSSDFEDCIWYVNSNSFFSSDDYFKEFFYGVRPVIEMFVDEIEIPLPSATMVNGDYDTVGSEVAIGDEHFYVISSDEDSVTMLAKYNLHVGNSIDADWQSAPLENPTGIQDYRTCGYSTDENGNVKFPFIGVTSFANSNSTYSGSIVEGYVNNYNSYLITQGVTPIEARLITKDEIVSLGCSDVDLSCSNAPDWVYSTSYWTGTAYDSFNIWRISTSGFGYTSVHYFGVRPVITIKKSDF